MPFLCVFSAASSLVRPRSQEQATVFVGICKKNGVTFTQY